MQIYLSQTSPAQCKCAVQVEILKLGQQFLSYLQPVMFGQFMLMIVQRPS